jgi:hypothetical protein
MELGLWAAVRVRNRGWGWVERQEMRRRREGSGYTPAEAGLRASLVVVEGAALLVIIFMRNR